MPVLPFGEYRPDVSDYQGEHTKNILNVFPRGDGYGPVPSLTAVTGAMAGACRGYFYAIKNDGSISVFAGTATKLYNLSNTDLTWTDVSKSAGTYTSLATTAQWRFAQFNNFVFAVQVNAPPQVFDLTSSTEFADLGGSPPQAAYISIVNRFVVLSGITTPNVYRIQWSGLNATTTWTSGITSSDFQDLPDGGFVLGMAGGESGVIFQQTSIRRMTFAPGTSYIFGIDRISQDDGLYAPGSLVSAGDRVFFCSPAGFKMIAPGGYPTPIGKEKVDRTFFADVDNANLQLMIGAHDPNTTRVYWAYKSINGQTALFDKILCYDWVLDKWSTITTTGEYIASLSRPGITLENLDTAYGSNIDTIVLSSMDNISLGALAALSAINSSHKLGFFTGANLEATLETPEKGGDGKRIYVNGFRPVTDAATVYGSVSKRETPFAASTYSTETQADSSTGVCPARVSTRYARGKIRIPAQSWTYAAGAEPEVMVEGTR